MSTTPDTNSHRTPLTPNLFHGSDSERINQAIITAAAAGGGRVVIPRLNDTATGMKDVWLLDSAILIRSNVTLELDNCRIKLSDRCRDNFIRSANSGVGIADIPTLENIHIVGRGQAILEGADNPRATGDSVKPLGQRTYGTDAGVAGENQNGDWRNIGILLAAVDHFSIENLSVRNTHCWAISLEWCAFGRIRDIDFAATGAKVIQGVRQTILNQDGLDLRQGCHDILIENITGHTGDDLVAFTAIPHAGETAGTLNSTMVSGRGDRNGAPGHIHSIILRNVRGYCHGHHIVRLLNTRGTQIRDILIDGLIDTSPPSVTCRAAIKIGDDYPVWGGVTPLGDTHRIVITNVISKATYTILIAGSLADSLISNVIRHGTPGDPVTFKSGPQYARNVTISNAVSV